MDMDHQSIAVGDDRVSAIFIRPPAASALFLFAHGAGAGMTHPAITANALGLAARGVATLRYQFLYMERSSKRPDQPALAHKVVRAAAAHAATIVSDLPLFAGGRSFGGRMTSQAQAETPLPGVRGLAFLGFPLHPAGKPGVDRAAHLQQISVPMLFLSGTRDALADGALLHSSVASLGDRATLHLVDQADHSFKVARKSGRTPAEVEADILDRLAAWMRAH